MGKCPHHYLVLLNLNYLRIHVYVRLCTECTMHYPAELKVFINEVINYSMYNIWTVKLHGVRTVLFMILEIIL